MMIEVLYEDKNLIVCIKPVGLTSQGEDDNSLAVKLANQIKQEVFPVHRLDQVVGGLMVYAKNSQAAGKLSGLMSQNKVTKEYLAIVSGHLDEKEGVFEDLLFHDKRKNKAYVVDKKRNGVKEAKLSYKVLACNAISSLVKVHLYTGRTHQIRVQFASRKHPLIGDGKYGDRTNKSDVALYSCYLKFDHPFKKEVLEFNSLPELSNTWKDYKEFTR